MELLKVNVGNGPQANANIICYDFRYNSCVLLSLISYDSTIKQILTEINQGKSKIYMQNFGSSKSIYKGYEAIREKDQETGYVHAIVYKKDEIKEERNGDEVLRAYVYTDLDDEFALYNVLNEDFQIPEKLKTAVYNKLYEHTPVPLLEEWMDYIIKELYLADSLSELDVFKPDDFKLKVFRLDISFSSLYKIVSNGLKDKHITINGTTEVSPEMESVTGLDSYLNNFTGILANKIQESFRPLFIPGEDAYSQALKDFDDYATYKGLRMYDAQKAAIQATSNNLDRNKVSFIIGEMGSGKTIMAIASVFTNIKKEGTTNIVICPSHLVEKWKQELDKYAPISKTVIIEDFNHFKSIEKEINDPRRRRHLFLIMSIETAKFGYEERPAVVWSNSKRQYTCPECGQGLYKKEYVGSGRLRRETKVPLREKDFMKKYVHNTTCTNEIEVWDKDEQTWKTKTCGANLWTPVIHEDNSDWVKLGNGQGWIELRHVQNLFDELTAKNELDRKESKFLAALSDVIAEAQDPNAKRIKRAPRKYPVAKYIKKYYKNKIDYLIADELHEYKSGTSKQGEAFGDLVSTAKKTIALTGTLLNGYASGLFYILYRTFPHLMKKEGFDYNNEMNFTKQYGVIRSTSRFAMHNGRQDRRIGGSKVKILPGVSPLVFTNFLLENAVFISLSDISEGMPGYREIPVGIQMDEDLAYAYEQLEENLRGTLGFHEGGTKTLGSLLQTLTVYPDQPYDQPPVMHPDTGDFLVNPPQLNRDVTRNKEQRFLEIVKEKVNAGEKVLVYYSWTNRTNLSERLPELLAEEGISSAVLKSSTVASKKRAEWINKKLEEGIDVLITNPSLVETGLDLLDFTTIIFYQIGYNLFTMRQAARRSWRLSQTKNIEVYFLYYENTIQEQALSLMATKLQAAQTIEGKFSEEGLHAMSNNEDLLTQIANSVVEGIRHTVDINVFGSIEKGNEIDAMLIDIEESEEIPEAKEVISVSSKAAKGRFPIYTIFAPTKKKRVRRKKLSKPTNADILVSDLFNKNKHVANLF